jgi:hypothetical protein
MYGPKLATLIGIVFLAASVAGCRKVESDPNSGVRSRGLGELHFIYRHYLRSHDRGPTALSDLEEYEQTNPMGYNLLKDGSYSFVWSVKATDSGTVIAYETAPTEGSGLVVTADGTIKTMSTAEIKELAKDKK